jgi:hypothetical protein
MAKYISDNPIFEKGKVVLSFVNKNGGEFFLMHIHLLSMHTLLSMHNIFFNA